MTETFATRQQILDRVRKATATGATAYESIPRAYIHRGSLNADDKLDLMALRLREYDAEVVECAPSEIAVTIHAQLAASGKRTFAAPAGLSAQWMNREFEWRIDNGLAYADLEATDGVVTAASAGVADSGTIVLHHGPEEGRRVLSLLPDWHLCVLRASQIVETLPEYFARFSKPPSLVTLISGPSATADIEMTRIKGVHGPRFLNVVLVRDANKITHGA